MHFLNNVRHSSEAVWANIRWSLGVIVATLLLTAVIGSARALSAEVDYGFGVGDWFLANAEGYGGSPPTMIDHDGTGGPGADGCWTEERIVNDLKVGMLARRGLSIVSKFVLTDPAAIEDFFARTDGVVDRSGWEEYEPLKVAVYAIDNRRSLIFMFFDCKVAWTNLPTLQLVQLLGKTPDGAEFKPPGGSGGGQFSRRDGAGEGNGGFYRQDGRGVRDHMHL